MTALLSVDRLSKRFGGLTVVDRLSFELAEGDALGIVGPNGAGKTTLLNLIAGDLVPTPARWCSTATTSRAARPTSAAAWASVARRRSRVRSTA